MISYNVIAHYNLEADTSIAERVLVRVVRRDMVPCGKRRAYICYRVLLDHDSNLPTRLLSVGMADYDKLTTPDAHLYVHPGRLGIRWLERIEPVP